MKYGSLMLTYIKNYCLKLANVYNVKEYSLLHGMTNVIVIGQKAIIYYGIWSHKRVKYNISQISYLRQPRVLEKASIYITQINQRNVFGFVN